MAGQCKWLFFLNQLKIFMDKIVIWQETLFWILVPIRNSVLRTEWKLRYSSCSGFVFHEKGFIVFNENCDFSLLRGGFCFAICSLFFLFGGWELFSWKVPGHGKVIVQGFSESAWSGYSARQHPVPPSLSLSLSLSLRYEFSAFLSSVNWVFAFLLFCSGSSV
jgi:hypothetical protein